MPDTSTPASSIVPAVGSSKPAIIRSVVVLPEPEGPSMVKNSPARISRTIPATAVTSPYCLVRPARPMSDEDPSIPRSYPKRTRFAGQIVLDALDGTAYGWKGLAKLDPLETGRVTRDVPFVGEEFFVPARARFVDAFVARGVEAEPGDRHVGMAGVGVDGDPAAFAFFSPALEWAGGEGAFEKFAAVEGEGDRTRAVVAGRGEGGVAAAPDVGLGADLVRRGDDRLDPERGGSGRDQFAARQQLRFRGRGADVD